ncbi:uncharacterized protein B0T23DRAFT_425839 [Neurospora hispaniola]|uniref:Uncharacterized protein n=1 Tax=Neurospora hispaniola TaxID=588809 RepID=A0AAJ0IBD7_9PEZI|nr:hypothetical protein B0T23DRAFT_425839 [Neurospora hispaniola]
MARDRKENEEDGEDGVDGVDGVGEEDGSRLWPTGRRTDAVLDYSRTPSKSSQSSARDGRMGLHVPLCKLWAAPGTKLSQDGAQGSHGDRDGRTNGAQSEPTNQVKVAATDCHPPRSCNEY